MLCGVSIFIFMEFLLYKKYFIVFFQVLVLSGDDVDEKLLLDLFFDYNGEKEMILMRKLQCQWFLKGDFVIVEILRNCCSFGDFI